MGNSASVDLKRDITSAERDAVATKWKGKLGLDQINHIIKTYKNKWAVDNKTFKAGIKQVYAVIQHPAICEDASDVLFKLWDKDHHNALTIADICDGIQLVIEGTSDEKADAAFNMIDTNGDGYVNKADIKAAVSQFIKISAAVSLKEAEESGAKNGQSEWDILANFVRHKPVDFLQQALIADIMLADRDGDKKITKENWRSEARTSQNIKILLDPYASTHIYKGAYDFINNSDAAGTTAAVTQDDLSNAVNSTTGETAEPRGGGGVLSQDEIAQALVDRAGFKLQLILQLMISFVLNKERVWNSRQECSTTYMKNMWFAWMSSQLYHPENLNGKCNKWESNTGGKGR
ncbi:calaxin [Planoprotostelium fungivorum]|uniref:Calaxin n=1 Tax=Planoprotostelium fungivorum TaxID=1890364 RepID=A0A2P6MXL3_9EUKA|nr:calaxin [Planoprotostelium fungivorum]